MAAEDGPALLPDLTNEDLKDLGIARLADRKRLLGAITLLSEDDDRDEAGPSSADMLAGERRQITALFADIAGYTKLSSELGAEETHALLNRYFETVDGIVPVITFGKLCDYPEQPLAIGKPRDPQVLKVFIGQLGKQSHSYRRCRRLPRNSG